MSNKAILQLPNGGARQAGDATIIVRSGVNYQLEVDAMIPALLSQSTVIASADVLTLFTTPVQVVDNAPAGYVNIAVKGVIQFSGGTSDYATNTTLNFGSSSTVSDTDFFMQSDIQDRGDPINAVVQTAGKAVVGDGISVAVATGNPTGGDSDLTITTWYYQLPVP